jgi:hypothetical protein
MRFFIIKEEEETMGEDSVPAFVYLMSSIVVRMTRIGHINYPSNLGLAKGILFIYFKIYVFYF